MSDGSITIEVRADDIKTKLQNKLETLINDPKISYEITKIIGKNVEKYVPYREGTLRNSAEIRQNTITWNTPYAHYQFMGDVYGPNFPVYIGGEWQWRSPRGEGTKYPTGRRLTYHTAGTTSDWVTTAWLNDKQRINLQITAYLKREARRRNLL